jgi:integrase
MKKSAKPKPISKRTVREINKLLRPAFAYAVTLGYIENNPTLNVQMPRVEKKKREQWTAAEVKTAIQCCEDPTFRLMMKLMFSCTLRTGELTALSYEDIVLDPKDDERPYVSVKKELARLNKTHIEQTKTEIYRTFPELGPKQKTVVVLKKPKTKSSVRKIYLPDELVEELRQHIANQKKEQAGNGFPSYDLLFCNSNGSPLADATLVKRFKKLIREHNLREVDMYSLRHSGATYKLTKSHDIKAVQADMGHSSADMIMEVYATIPLESRQQLADHTDSFLKDLDKTEQDGQQTTEKTNEDETNTTN